MKINSMAIKVTKNKATYTLSKHYQSPTGEKDNEIVVEILPNKKMRLRDPNGRSILDPLNPLASEEVLYLSNAFKQAVELIEEF